MIISNQTARLEDLPAYVASALQSPHPAYRKHMMITRSLVMILATGAAGFWLYKKGWHQNLTIALPVLCILVAAWASLLWLAAKSFANQGFALREHDIIIKKGWLFEKMQLVPLNKVQHTQRTTDPLERLLKLSSIQVFTAGQSDATIKGLGAMQAEQVREWLAAKLPEQHDIPEQETVNHHDPDAV